jgi:hypothetical protein
LENRRGLIKRGFRRRKGEKKLVRDWELMTFIEF